MMDRQRWLASPWPASLTICAAAVVWILVFGDPLEGFEMRWLGETLRWRNAAGVTQPVDANIVHLDISQSDLDAMPSLESEYEKAAAIIGQAASLGAKVVVFDVIFARGTPGMAQPILTAAAAAAAHNCTVVLAEAMLPAPGGGVDRARSFPFRERYQPAGLINIQADDDGVSRHYAFVRQTAGGAESSLALAAYLAWRDAKWDDVEKNPGAVQWDEIGPDMTSVQRHRAPVPPVLLNFRGEWRDVFRHYTIPQFLAQRPGSLANSIVIVSYIATGVGDIGTTPFGPDQPRVLLHSTALNDLIQQSWLRRTPRYADALALALLLLIALGNAAFRRLSTLVGWWLLGETVILLLGVALIWEARWVPASIMVLGVGALMLLVEIVRRYSVELIERLRLRSTMSFYFSPRVLDRVLKNPGSMQPQEVDLTVLLTDLRNSTPLAELLGAHGTFDLLNKVFEAETRSVMAEDGTLEHFLGDQFLAYWGAPDPQPDAADRACRAALALIGEMEALRAQLSGEVHKLFGYGVALHRGDALIGNKGSAQRLDYGVVGDLINSAARVESLTKKYGVPFLVTRELFDTLSNPPPHRVLDRVIVKGKSVAVELIELCNPRSPGNFQEISAFYSAAFAQYQQANFAPAARLFAAIANDPPSHLLAERCQALEKTPPLKWNGVFAFDDK